MFPSIFPELVDRRRASHGGFSFYCRTGRGFPGWDRYHFNRGSERCLLSEGSDSQLEAQCRLVNEKNKRFRNYVKFNIASAYQVASVRILLSHSGRFFYSQLTLSTRRLTISSCAQEEEETINGSYLGYWRNDKSMKFTFEVCELVVERFFSWIGLYFHRPQTSWFFRNRDWFPTQNGSQD